MKNKFLAIAGITFLLSSMQANARSTAPDPIQVGAYYFGFFSPEAPYLSAVKTVYGRADWRGGVRDFYERSGPAYAKWKNGSFDHLKPQIGHYDQSKVETLEKHIDQAADGGLTFFNFYFYWSQSKKQSYVDAGLRSFMLAKN